MKDKCVNIRNGAIKSSFLKLERAQRERERDTKKEKENTPMKSFTNYVNSTAIDLSATSTMMSKIMVI